MWRLMLITSQKEEEPQTQKGYVYDEVKGVKSIKLRIAINNAMDIWGTRVLPVINGKSELGQKLIREAHEKTMHTLGRSIPSRARGNTECTSIRRERSIHPSSKNPCR